MELTRDEKNLLSDILWYYANYQVSTKSPLYEEIMRILDKIAEDVLP